VRGTFVEVRQYSRGAVARECPRTLENAACTLIEEARTLIEVARTPIEVTRTLIEVPAPSASNP
jgi:hypothetical protein